MDHKITNSWSTKYACQTAAIWFLILKKKGKTEQKTNCIQLKQTTQMSSGVTRPFVLMSHQHCANFLHNHRQPPSVLSNVKIDKFCQKKIYLHFTHWNTLKLEKMLVSICVFVYNVVLSLEQDPNRLNYSIATLNVTHSCAVCVISVSRILFAQPICMQP